jgi:hypothetical protein
MRWAGGTVELDVDDVEVEVVLGIAALVLLVDELLVVVGTASRWLCTLVSDRSVPALPSLCHTTTRFPAPSPPIFVQP